MLVGGVPIILLLLLAVHTVLELWRICGYRRKIRQMQNALCIASDDDFAALIAHARVFCSRYFSRSSMCSILTRSRRMNAEKS